MQTNYELVREFHVVFGHPANTEPQTNVFIENDKLVKFRLSQIEEEMTELKTAVTNKDFIECLDAICDLMYFVYGSFLVFGVNFDTLKEKQKIRLFDDSPKNNSNIFKNDPTGLQRQLDKLEQLFSLLTLSCEENDFNSMICYLAKLEAQCNTLGSLFGVDIQTCFSEVHRSNMTKVCLDEQIAQKTVDSYIDTKNLRNTELESATTDEEKSTINEKYKVYNEPAYRKSDTTKYWVVYDIATSKILKSVNFELPKIARVIGFDPSEQVVDLQQKESPYSETDTNEDEDQIDSDESQ
jgi:predicted HAD superfamily Cof-like phosphohydrolase